MTKTVKRTIETTKAVCHITVHPKHDGSNSLESVINFEKQGDYGTKAIEKQFYKDNELVEHLEKVVDELLGELGIDQNEATIHLKFSANTEEVSYEVPVDLYVQLARKLTEGTNVFVIKQALANA